ncbi:hypothetical protein [Paenibacillus silvae]|uniref:Flagellar protein FliT n=1 Tax=Paenibacillus silvae TaxID=1325358 RepID=A0A2W6NMD5_9BACL|nr:MULTISPECIES: hypothetical protein [Paenibacillus]MCK6075675.1 hypothetical protein [Paenibacillus silvae]MCK6150063.1 hypothetical protein [Paenibacillus silvae]MCK6268361.1 hypothetical protein [Paenibacillus silvae]PZT56951.1 hypothetical protein DN757_04750 [Paenibacillus silvae]
MTISGEYIDCLYDLTLQVIHRLDVINYEEMASFVDQRESLVNNMKADGIQLNESDKAKVEQLLEYDQILINKMSLLKNEAASWLNKQGTIRVQKNAYSSNYAPDSLFFDMKN